MARTVRTKIYKFNELSPEAKKKAIQWYESIGGNVFHEWWDITYEDAKMAGIEITGFDIDRGSYCNGEIMDMYETAEYIKANHGENCSTFSTAFNFLKQAEEIEAKYEVDSDERDTLLDDLEAEFKKSILEDYRIMLSKEYDYLTSEEAIIESIVSNEYEFIKTGERFKA